MKYQNICQHVQFLIIAVLIAVAVADKPVNKRAQPAYKPAPAYPAAAYPGPDYSKSYDYVSIACVYTFSQEIN